MQNQSLLEKSILDALKDHKISLKSLRVIENGNLFVNTSNNEDKRIKLTRE
jgi:hypothetical protein